MFQYASLDVQVFRKLCATGTNDNMLLVAIVEDHALLQPPRQGCPPSSMCGCAE